MENPKCPKCKNSLRHSNIEEDKWVCKHCNEVFDERQLGKKTLDDWLGILDKK